MTQAEIDRLFDELAALVDRTPPAERERLLARLVIALARQVDDYARIRQAIEEAATEQSGTDQSGTGTRT